MWEGGSRFPMPLGWPKECRPDAVLYDVSDRDLIQVTAMPAEVEVNRHRARIERQIDGYGAFLGVPFLFTSYRNAIRLHGVRSGRSHVHSSACRQGVFDLGRAAKP